MQNLIYDKAVYDILYYDANTDAYRIDRFAGWQNQPANGVPMFTYSTLGYTKLTDAKLAPSPAPSSATASGSPGASAAVASPAASGTTTHVSNGTDTGSSAPLLAGLAALVAVVAVGLVWFSRRRNAAAAADEDE